MTIPIEITPGVILEPSKIPGLATAIVKDLSAKTKLSWDRFVRLKKVASTLNLTNSKTVLDAGGYDGAIAFFLENTSTDVIDPATTGGSVLSIPVANQSYDAVIAVDVLEHIKPEDRNKALSEFTRVARKHLILNFPCTLSKEAQELVLRLTNNSLIREHVEWDLPDSKQILTELSKHGFKGSIQTHTSQAIWLGQYVVQNLLPEVGREINHYLILNHEDEETGKPLYHMIVATRKN
jgi:hypothetical protein